LAKLHVDAKIEWYLFSGHGAFGLLVHYEHVYVRCEGQGHMSKFTRR